MPLARSRPRSRRRCRGVAPVARAGSSPAAPPRWVAAAVAMLVVSATAPAVESVAPGWTVVDVGPGVKPGLDFAADGTAFVMGMTETFGGTVWVAEGSGRPGEPWEITTMAGGYFYGPGDLLVDRAGDVHVAWHNHDTPGPHHVRFSPGSGAVDDNKIPSPTHDGWDCSLALGPDGAVHLASINPSNFGAGESLQLGVFDGAGWSYEFGIADSGATMYGFNTAVQVAADGTAHVLHCRASDWAAPGDLVHSTRAPGGDWSHATISDGGPVGRFPSLTTTSDGTLHAAWLDIDPVDPSIGDVTVGTLAPGSTSWSSAPVATLDAVVLGFSGARKSVSIDAGPDDTLHLAFGDTSLIKYASRAPGAGSWTVRDVVSDPDGQPYRGLSVVRARPDGSPAIAFWQGLDSDPLTRLASLEPAPTGPRRAGFQATLTRNPTDGTLTLAWPTEANATYQPESSPDATSTSWLPVGDAIPGDGTTATIPLGTPSGGSPTNLYRVVETR